MSEDQFGLTKNSQQYQLALSRWDDDGGAMYDGAVILRPAGLQPEFHPLTNAELGNSAFASSRLKTW